MDGKVTVTEGSIKLINSIKIAKTARKKFFFLTGRKICTKVTATVF